MKKILSIKLVYSCLFVFFVFLGFTITKVHAQSIDTEGCCKINDELCYGYNNRNSAGTKNFNDGNCLVNKGSVIDNQICVDLYYQQTDTSIKNDNDLPAQGVRCIEKPVKLDEAKTDNNGILSKNCLSTDGSSIKNCLISSFFPNIGLPGSDQLTTNSESTKYLLLSKIGLVIGLVLGAAGIVFLILIIYAGIQWLLAGDEEKKVSDSKDMIRNAITGLIITMFAYGLSYFVFSVLTRAS